MHDASAYPAVPKFLLLVETGDIRAGCAAVGMRLKWESGVVRAKNTASITSDAVRMTYARQQPAACGRVALVPTMGGNCTTAII